MKFSIIVPVFNVEKQLTRCLDCLINQDYPDIEIVLVDDGSTDSSGEICDRYMQSDPRIVVVHKENGGLSSARNTGLERITGDYIIYVDSDDYVELNFCRNICNYLERTQAEIVVINIRKEKGTVIKDRTISSIKEGEIVSGRDYLKRTIRNNEFNAESYACVYSRAFWEDNGFKYVDKIFHEDMELSIRVFDKARKVAYLSDTYYHAVYREGSITTNINNGKKRYSDMLWVIKGWLLWVAQVNDSEMAAMIRGLAAKILVYSSIQNRVSKPDFSVISRVETLRWALNYKEFLKAVLLILNPGFLYFIYDMFQNDGI